MAISTPVRKRVAILGGGLGSLTTAYELSSRGYDITVYQLGWRLGGQGASGRNPADGRIEEHGLHIWFGFYHNAFTMMRDVYDEYRAQIPAPVSPIQNVEQAFVGADEHLFLEHIDGDVRRWLVRFPADSDFPWTGSSSLPTPRDIFERLIGWLKDHFDERLAHHMPAAASVSPAPAHPLLARMRDSLVADIGVIEGAFAVSTVTVALHAATVLSRHVHADPTAASAVATILHDVGACVRTHLIGTSHDEARRAFILFDLGVSLAKGMVRDDVLVQGLAKLDRYDFREWLRLHGASELAVSSAVMQGFYDASFSYEAGRTDQPNLAAGVGVRCVLRIIFCYKGHILFKMTAGMGDAIFAPLYRVLRARGVKFEFFHRVTSLEPGLIPADAPGTRGIARIHLVRQVDLEQSTYEPLITVNDLPCWPSAPLVDQIVDGGRLKGVNLESYWSGWKDAAAVTLEAGRDYDIVVLGISVGALPPICEPLLAEGEPKRDAWAEMFSKVQTVRTQAIQLWCRRNDEATGWGAPGGIIACADEPEASWADFSQVLPREGWPASAGVDGLFYGCGPVADTSPPVPPPEDTAFPAEQLQKARALSDRFLAVSGGPLWPNATGPGGLDPAMIVARYDRVNIDPSERYVLPLKGSTSAKLPPDGSGYPNLFLTGCWVANGINLSSVEGTVMAGMSAAAAVSGESIPIAGDEDWQ